MNQYEVYGFRLKEYNCSDSILKCGYFSLKIFVGDNSWINIKDIKLMKGFQKGYYILPPAEFKDGKFWEFLEFSDDIFDDVSINASKMYETQKQHK